MIQNVTEPAFSFAAPAAVVAHDSEGADFEASLAEDEPVDATEDGEPEEAAAEVAVLDVIGLEQFVQKPEIVLATAVETTAGASAVPLAAAGAEVVAPPVTATVATPDAAPGVALQDAAIEVPQGAALPDKEQPATPGAKEKAMDLTGPPAASTEEGPPETTPHHKTRPDERQAEIPDITSGPNSTAESPAKPGLDNPNSPTPGLVAADVTLHQARESRPELSAQPLATQRHGVAEARQVARQLARQVSADHDRIEITLTPEELGKVRLVMTPGDTPTVSVYADNQDTLALLRRHADVLMRELSDTGFGGASLSFGEGGESGNSPQTASFAREGGVDTPANDKTAPAKPVSDRRLDIRI